MAILNLKRNLGKTRAQARTAEKARRASAQRVPKPTTARQTTRKPPSAPTVAPSRDRPSRRSLQEGGLTRRGVPVATPLAGDPTPLAQPERAEERQARIEKFSGPKVFQNRGSFERNKDDLQKFAREQRRLFEMGEIEANQVPTGSQLFAALNRLEQGFSGVDPLGFNANAVLPQVGRTKFDPETGRPSSVAARRPDVFGLPDKPAIEGRPSEPFGGVEGERAAISPLVSTLAGAGGLGFRGIERERIEKLNEEQQKELIGLGAFSDDLAEMSPLERLGSSLKRQAAGGFGIVNREIRSFSTKEWNIALALRGAGITERDITNRVEIYGRGPTSGQDYTNASLVINDEQRKVLEELGFPAGFHKFKTGKWAGRWGINLPGDTDTWKKIFSEADKVYTGQDLEEAASAPQELVSSVITGQEESYRQRLAEGEQTEREFAREERERVQAFQEPVQDAQGFGEADRVQTDMINQDISSTKVGIADLSSRVDAQPDIFSVFLPEIQALSRENNAIQRAFSLELAQHPDAITVAAAAGRAEEFQSAMALDRANQLEFFAKDTRDLKIRSSEMVMDLMQVEKSRFEIGQIQRENTLRKENAKTEIRARRRANKFGIASDTNGLAAIQETIDDGNEALRILSLQGDLTRNQFAIQIGRRYKLDTDIAYNAYDARIFQIDSNLEDRMANIRKTISQDAASKNKARVKLISDAMKEKAKLDVDLARVQRDINQSVLDEIESRREAALDRQKAGRFTIHETTKFANDFAVRLGSLPEMKSFREINDKFLKMETIFNDKTIVQAVKDEALLATYEKILDPESVVRESEFLRVVRAQGFTIQSKETFRRELRALRTGEGGQPISDRLRRSLIAAGREFREIALTNVMFAIQPTLARIENINQRAVDPIEWEEVLDPRVLRALPIPRQFNSLEESYAGEATSMRTDRHNNPTALMWTSRLESWFQDRGHNVVKGDKFPKGDNFTLDMTGVDDPISATIDYIDAHTFFLYGNKRWPHTAIPKVEWDRLSRADKAKIIEQMYKREGGSGELFTPFI